MTKEQIESLGLTYVDGMTDDEVIAKITEKHQSDANKLTELENSSKKWKAQFDKASTEIAEFKRQNQEKLTDEEKAKAHLEEVEMDLAKANRKIAETEKVNTYMAIGYPKELAEKVACAELDGKDVTKYHQEFIKAHDATLEAELMKKNPALKGGGGNGGDDTIEDKFKKGTMTMPELNELKNSNPSLYKKLLGIE